MLRFALPPLIAAAVTATAPAAAPARVEPVRTQVSALPAAKVSLTVNVTGEQQCTLTAPGVRARTSAETARQLTFTFGVHRRARPGAYRATVSCAAGRTRVTIRVRRARRTVTRTAARPFHGPVRVTAKQAAPAPPPSRPPAPVPPPAPAASPVDYDQLAETLMQTLIDRVRASGQCTGWVATKREDLVRAVDRPRILQGLQTAGASPALLTTSDAKDWGKIARAAGRTVTGVPTSGSVFVGQPGAFGSGSAGHVAYVENVSTADGMTTVTLSEWNAPVLGATTFRDITYDASVHLIGVEFIT
jgi:surface antigen